ncbi:MAG: choice-of-anchor Q domain-containing protein [Myxococcota bacterium]
MAALSAVATSGCPVVVDLRSPDAAVLRDGGLPPAPGDPFDCAEAATPPPEPERRSAVGRGTPESCTEAALRAALETGEALSFDCGPAPHVLTLLAPLAIDGTQDLDGGGRVRLDGANATRLFTLAPGATLVLRRLTLQNAQSNVGAVASIEGDQRIVLDEVLVTEAEATDVSPPGAAPRVGGGAFRLGEGSTLVAYGSFFSTCRASVGGAIFVDGGRVALRNVRARDQVAEGGLGHGGTFAVGRGALTYCDGLVAGSRAGGSGGALWVGAGSATLARVHIVGAIAGGADPRLGGYGGAIALEAAQAGATPSLTVLASTFESNVARIAGGAVAVRAGRAALHNVTSFRSVAEQGGGIALLAGELELRHVTLAGDEAREGAALFTAEGTRAQLENSLAVTLEAPCAGEGERLGSGWLQRGGDPCLAGALTGDARLAPELDRNADPPVLPLGEGSDAIDAGDAERCLPEDQRGAPRPPEACDLGAFEREE